MERDGVSASSADEIISRQKICSDYTVNIVNDGDLELLRRRVERAIAETLNRWRCFSDILLFFYETIE